MAKITTITNPLTGQPAQVDQLEHTAQQIDDGLNIARGVSNPNLLDNWYFGNPVDQRQGHVVKPNTTYCSDNTLTTSAGTTSAYVTAYRYATGTASGVNYVSFKLEDSDTAPTYYAAPENVVRGYTGAVYGPDRWLFDGSNAAMLIEDSGLHFVFTASATGNEAIHQRFDNPGRYSGKIVTYSMLGSTDISFGMLLLVNGSIFGSANSGVVTGETLFSKTVTLPDNITSLEAYYYPKNSSGAGEAYVSGCKLELGTQQTLAHQDANGNWVLNEIPDYGEQLLRCQRYFQTFATESLRPTNALDFRPVMRTNPVLSTINVDGKTLYTASADL